MHYEKASAEVITFVNGCFITTSPEEIVISEPYEERVDNEEKSRPSRSRDYRPSGRRRRN